jgi:hypothetical protein
MDHFPILLVPEAPILTQIQCAAQGAADRTLAWELQYSSVRPWSMGWELEKGASTLPWVKKKKGYLTQKLLACFVEKAMFKIFLVLFLHP